MQFGVTIEIPQGRRSKYEVDHETGAGSIWTGTDGLPTDYGFIEVLLGDDGALDALVFARPVPRGAGGGAAGGDVRMASTAATVVCASQPPVTGGTTSRHRGRSGFRAGYDQAFLCMETWNQVSSSGDRWADPRQPGRVQLVIQGRYTDLGWAPAPPWHPAGLSGLRGRLFRHCAAHLGERRDKNHLPESGDTLKGRRSVDEQQQDPWRAPIAQCAPYVPVSVSCRAD